MKQMFLAAAFAVWSVTGAQAQDADIRAVITQQFDAFKVDDFATAFTFASPSLQGFFQNPQNFGLLAEGPDCGC